jgi:hypothetical protein
MTPTSSEDVRYDFDAIDWSRGVQGLRERHPDWESKALVREQLNAELLAAGRPVIYGEGDSWFDFPLPFFPPLSANDLLDALQRYHRYVVYRDSKAGDTIKNMARFENLQFIEHQIRVYRPMAFLVSGGGNDLFTGADVDSTVFSQILNPKGSNQPYDKVRLEAFLTEMAANLLKVAGVGISLGIPTILHGYANAYPSGNPALHKLFWKVGPWIRKPFEKKGYNPDTEGRPILWEIIGRANDATREVADSVDLLHYVDLRPVVLERHWHDELHLRPSGWHVTADVMHEKIASL